MISTALERIHIRSIDFLIKNNLAQRFFTSGEIEYSKRFKDSSIHLAGCLAAKLAYLKASSGIHQSPFKKIKIKHNSNGKPFLFFEDKKISSCSISISHTKSVAVAFCIIKDGNLSSEKKKR